MPGTDETCSDGIFYFNYADFCRSIDLYGGDKDDASELAGQYSGSSNGRIDGDSDS